MTEQHTIHFAADEEMLERFVLGRLNDADRRAAEQHLESCDACANAVRAERLLAAGTKRLGRDSFKRSMRTRLAETRARVTPWPRILSAAAMLGILVGIGLYNRWFTAGTDITPTLSETSREIQTQQPAGKAQPAPEPSQPSEKALEGKRDHDVTSPRQDTYARSAAEQPAAQKDILRSNEVAGGAARSDIAVARPAVADAAPAPAGEQTTTLGRRGMTGQAFWTEGVPLTREEERGGADAISKREAEPRELLMQKSAKPKVADAHKEEGMVEATAAFRIDQRPASALPRERKMLQQQGLKNTVQTRVEQQGNTTMMTLYLDSLLDAGEMKRANVQAVSDDSVVVNVGNQRIGYKLPAGYPMQQGNVKK